MLLRRRAFTVMEVLVATALTLILLGSVVQLFAWMSNSLNEARSALEMQDRLRGVAQLLQRDLRSVTTPMLPPRNPANNEGYFEYIEGAMGISPWLVDGDAGESAAGSCDIPVNTHSLDRLALTGTLRDHTVTDVDDILMFTVRSPDRPYVGLNGASGASLQSPVAEVAWFVRGKTLYRRQLLVAPNATVTTGYRITSQIAPLNTALSATLPGGAYNCRDVSLRSVPDTGGGLMAVPNSLGDLTKRENRYGHPIVPSVMPPGEFPYDYVMAFPYDVSRWGPWRMPTRRESWDINYWPGGFPKPYRQGNGVKSWATLNPLDWWRGYYGKNPGREYWGGEFFPDCHNPYNWHLTPDPGPPYVEDWIFASANTDWLPASDRDRQILQSLGAAGQSGSARTPIDIVMTDVIGFDVKAWDPGAPLYRFTIGGSGNDMDYVTLTPGDPGYPRAAAMYAQNSTNSRVAIVGYGAFVNLGYLPDSASWARDASNRQVSGFRLRNPAGAPQPHFNNVFDWDRLEAGYYQQRPNSADGDYGKRKAIALGLSRVYDTWSTHYDSDPILRRFVWENYLINVGIKPNTYWPLPDPTNVLADEFAAMPDPAGAPWNYAGLGPDSKRESFFRPPYPHPLRAIQVRIRGFEPSSRQVREITIKQDFLIR